jgi:CelD/BcsL family acetyltransferase involved in cellulose biosynthesis
MWDRCRGLEFLGTGRVASDYLNFIVDPAEGCAVLAALVRYLAEHREEWDVLSLSDVDEKAWTLSMIRTLFQLKGFDAVLSLAPGSQCRYARLDEGWEPYLRSRSPKLRHQIKQKGILLEERYGARFETLERAGDIPRMFESLVALHRDRLATLGKVSTLLDDSMVAFLRGATPLLFERGWLRLCALVSGGRPLAMIYGLAYRGTFYDYQKGMDVEWSKWGVGTVLQGLCIKQASAEGLIEYDLLRGDESYKDRWAAYTRQTMRLDIVQRSPRTWIYRGARRLVRGIREARQRVQSVMRTR